MFFLWLCCTKGAIRSADLAFGECAIGQMLELKQRVGILAKDNQLFRRSITNHQMKKGPKQTYRVKNWREYNKSLKQRGSLTFWIDREVIDEWENKEKTGRRGASNKYSDLAIKTMLTIKVLYRLPGRQAQGFLESIFEMIDINLSVPDPREDKK